MDGSHPSNVSSVACAVLCGVAGAKRKRLPLAKSIPPPLRDRPSPARRSALTRLTKVIPTRNQTAARATVQAQAQDADVAPNSQSKVDHRFARPRIAEESF